MLQKFKKYSPQMLMLLFFGIIAHLRISFSADSTAKFSRGKYRVPTTIIQLI